MAYDVTITRAPLAALFDMRATRTVMASAGSSLGAPMPPDTPNTATSKDGITVMWVAERRFMVHGPLEREATMATIFSEKAIALNAARRDSGRGREKGGGMNVTSAMLVSDAYARFDIEGPDAVAIVAQATPLDIREPEFPESAATFTEVFYLTGILYNAPGLDGFALWVERSYGDYIEACLNAAAGK